MLRTILFLALLGSAACDGAPCPTPVPMSAQDVALVVCSGLEACSATSPDGAGQWTDHDWKVCLAENGKDPVTEECALGILEQGDADCTPLNEGTLPEACK